MRVLIIKTSSLGDVIHTLPALTDAAKVYPTIQFDWLVEESFAEIPRWHESVQNVIPMAFRRWRKTWWRKDTRDAWRHCRNTLQQQPYDLIIDAQGLLKSALFAWGVKGRVAGLGWKSAREPLASLFYDKKITVNKHQHAITRTRALFSEALQYPLPTTVPVYGIPRDRFMKETTDAPYLVFLHGTTWASKHWPESYWKALAGFAKNQGLRVKLLWGNAEERARAERLAEEETHVEVLPRLTLLEIASTLANARAVVTVDTGLGHLAAALAVPLVSLYSSTDPALTGMLGRQQKSLKVQFPCAPCFGRECTYRDLSSLKSPSPLKSFTPPCFETLSPTVVWGELLTLL